MKNLPIFAMIMCAAFAAIGGFYAGLNSEKDEPALQETEYPWSGEYEDGPDEICVIDIVGDGGLIIENLTFVEPNEPNEFVDTTMIIDPNTFLNDAAAG